MTQTIDQASTQAPAETDLVAAVHGVLQASADPMTVSKIRAALPAQLRSVSPEELTETLNRQVAANVLYQYPRYRSQQDRFWDRPMPVHVANLVCETLQEQPLTWSELRRKLPGYAQNQAESVLQEQVGQGKVYRHPRTGRGGDRYGVQPANPSDYLRSELVVVFRKLEKFGFTQEQLRHGALELLHDEEWASVPAAAEAQGEREEAEEEEEAGAGRQETPAARSEQPAGQDMPAREDDQLQGTTQS